MKRRRCPQCWQQWPKVDFVGASGRLVNWCAGCREKYRGWDRLTPDERAAVTRGNRAKLDVDQRLRVRFVRRSKNRKVGDIPVTSSSPSTCPPSCGLYGAGCYAEVGHWTRLHWSRVPRDGLTWGELCDAVRALPPGQVWRHNEAGDLPGLGDTVDPTLLRMLVEANEGRRGFTYTHKPLRRAVEREAVRRANQRGLTVNLSADSLADVDRLAALGIAPVVVVVPRGHPRLSRTPGGRPVVVCPNETHGLSCERCRLCAVPLRRTVVAFRAHGPAATSVEGRLAQLRLPGVDR